MTDASPRPVKLSPAECVSLACLWEATAPKVGNVHRGADFQALRFTDFLTSATLIGPVLAQASQEGVGRSIYEAITRTRSVVGTNTNLGIVLLLAPLAAVPGTSRLTPGIIDVLNRLTSEDAAWVYRAIALAQPGGMGQVAQDDVAGPPPQSLVSAMQAAAERDLIARQFATGFRDVLDFVAPELEKTAAQTGSLTLAIVDTHLRLIAELGDTLIARKCGSALASQAQTRAKVVLAAGLPGDENYESAAREFDFWLRSDGQRRNPGATADLIAAGLFVGFRDGLFPLPWK